MDFAPDPALSRSEMESLQREIAAAATFTDDIDFTPEDVRDGDALVAGVDQAFLLDEDPERALSAVVVARGGEVIERTHAVTELSIPYIPGLLAFREGGPILAALDTLESDPDLFLFDGSGRIHYREAGLATHVGVIADTPSVGVAKSLLCGEPRGSVDGLAEGERVAIDGDDQMPTDEVVGYAYQSRQFDSGRINPLYVSPGHRVSAETAVEFVAACGGEYKLPEPTRQADAYADEKKQEYADTNA
ncbi:endonuclease V [Halosegnis longus]|uniref:endonuclease V n=1 Tax=Halosegnis longus TaxID=2216012 RepID=UPI00096A8098|nr:endonuclease V [Salella cibi]